MNLHPTLTPVMQVLLGFAGSMEGMSQTASQRMSSKWGRALKGWVVKHDSADSSYQHECNLNAQQCSVLNYVKDAAPHQCHHPWRHFSTTSFLPISPRGTFNTHEVTAAATPVDAPPPVSCLVRPAQLFWEVCSGPKPRLGSFLCSPVVGVCQHKVSSVCLLLAPSARGHRAKQRARVASLFLYFTRSIPI